MEEVNLKFRRGSTSLLVVGASCSGKTHFVADLVRHRSVMFDPEPVEIYWVYNSWQELYTQLQHDVPSIKFIDYIPDKTEIQQITNDKKPRLIILDDQMVRLQTHADVTEYFTVYCHHYNLNTVVILQALFYPHPVLRNISLNVQGLVIFRNLRSEQQVATLARQMFGPKMHYFMDAYRKAMTQGPFNYIFVDLDPTSSKHWQLRTNILPGKNTIVYTPKK